MNNLQSNVKKLSIAVYALVIVSVFNLTMLVIRSPQQQEHDVLWEENLQSKIQELQSSLELLDKKMNNLRREIPQVSDYTTTLENSMQNSVSLILTNIETKRNKFKHLSKKITDLSKDISTLKKRFSAMKTEEQENSMAKKNPVTAIQEAIEEEEKEQQPRKIRLYTLIVGLCCLVNLFILPMSTSSENETLLDTEIPIEIVESLGQLRRNITTLEASVENFARTVAKPSAVKPVFEKKMGKSIELIIQRLLDMDTSLNNITENIKEIRKEVVYLEQKQIEIKEDLRNK